MACGLRLAACDLRLVTCGLRLAACGLRLAAFLLFPLYLFFLKRKAAAPQHATRNTHRASVIVHRNEHLETCNAHRLTRTPQHKTGACARAAERAGGAASSEGAAADNGRWGRRQQRATCADAPAKTVACARAAERAGGATSGDGAATDNGRRGATDNKSLRSRSREGRRSNMRRRGGEGQQQLAHAQPRAATGCGVACGVHQPCSDLTVHQLPTLVYTSVPVYTSVHQPTHAGVHQCT